MRFEPGSALVAADHGLADLAAIVGQAPHHWQPQVGCCWIMAGSRARARALLQAAGFSAVATHRDYGDNDRVTLRQWPG